MPYGDKQNIIFVFTPEYGKIKIIVDKKKVRNRYRVEDFELFSEYMFLLKKGRNFDKCLESDVYCSYSKIIENYDQILCAEYFLETIYMVTPFFIPDEKIYNLLKKIFLALSLGMGKEIIPKVLMSLIEILGIEPSLEISSKYGNNKIFKGGYFNFHDGIFTYPECCKHENYSFFISEKLLSFLISLKNYKVSILQKIYSQSIFFEAESFLRKYLMFNLGISSEIKSAKLLIS
jgi:DNA repair protein RecO